MENKLVINGLVLAGGKSVRMGRDKGLLNWNGKEQRHYIADLLKEFCSEVYISCRQNQVETIPSSYKTIADKYDGLGPLGAVISAFHFDSNCAWLVVACDLPLLDKNTISFLLQHRTTSAIATTYKNPHDGLPEPLLTIWEPKSFALLQNSLAKGRLSLRQVLLNNNTQVISALDPSALVNVNTLEEAAAFKGRLPNC